MPEAPIVEPAPGPRTLFLAFAKISMTSFGGGLTGWVMQDIVRRRRWMGEEEFLAGLAMSQALPGVNVVNLAIWIGYRLGGGRSALLAVMGIILPPMVMVSLFAAIYDVIIRFSVTHRAIEGAVAASIGLTLAMGLRVGWRNLDRVVPAVVMAVVFLTVGVLKLPILPVLGVVVPLSVVLAYRRELRDAR
jgi:chromate transporter